MKYKLGMKVRSWDFPPQPDRLNRFVEGYIVAIDEANNCLTIDVERDTLSRREQVQTPADDELSLMVWQSDTPRIEVLESSD